MKRTGHETRDMFDVFDRYNVCDEQDDLHAAELLAGRLDVASAIAGNEPKGTTGRKSATPGYQMLAPSARRNWWTILDLNQ